MLAVSIRPRAAHEQTLSCAPLCFPTASPKLAPVCLQALAEDILHI